MRSKAGHRPFSGKVDPKISTFTLIDSGGRLKNLLEGNGYHPAGSLTENCLFHIQVVFTEAPNAPFSMDAAQVAKVRPR